MNRQNDEYEVIIIGSGLGGLIAGTLLSIKNQKVLLLKEKRYSSNFIKNGYCFIPFSNFSEKRLKLKYLKKLSQILDLSLQIDNDETGDMIDTGSNKIKHELVFQVILPKARVDIFKQYPMLQTEWKREFPNEVTQIEHFYNEIKQYQHLLLKKRKMKEDPLRLVSPIRPKPWIKRWFSFNNPLGIRLDERLSSFSKDFREFIQLQLISRGNLYSEQFPIPIASSVLFNDGEDEWSVNVDSEKLKNNIFDKYYQSGGTIENIERGEAIDIKQRKGFTITLKAENKIFRSKALILNCPLHRCSNIIVQPKKLRLNRKRTIRPKFLLYPLFLEMHEKGVPVGMGDLIVSIFDLNQSYEKGNVLLISIAQNENEVESSRRGKNLIVESLIPLEKNDSLYMVDHQTGVMKHLHHLFPFSESNIQFMDWNWTEEQIECWSYPHMIFEAPSYFNWRKEAIPIRILNNLYFVGKENFPYLGVEGEIFCGLIAGQQILKNIHRSSHYRKTDEVDEDIISYVS